MVFRAAVAPFLVVDVGVLAGNFLVVFVNNQFHVVHTAVDNFDVLH